jgi:hypothetical protein
MAKQSNCHPLVLHVLPIQDTALQAPPLYIRRKISLLRGHFIENEKRNDKL